MKYSEESYNSLIQDIFRRHPSVQKEGFTSGAYKIGLERIMAFDESLGQPWKKFRSIHVAGTNGKGSVCSMIAASLASSGLRIGLYTSPHLVDFRERARILGEGTIGQEAAWEFLTTHDLEGLSFFEITTEMAFWWFALEKVDVAVIEVGLGGLLDSTNIITPELSVITSIGLDHCQMLGNTPSLIAAQKAGIFKKGVPAVVWGRDSETESVFEKQAAEIGCPLYFANEEDLPIEEDEFENILHSMDLEGPCQRYNLRTSLVALSMLEADRPDFSCIRGPLCNAGKSTCLRGRWERLNCEPEVICDIGHNPAALKINFAMLEQTGRPLIIVYGIMADKDLDSIASLMPADAHYFLVEPHTDRALDVSVLAARLSTLRPDLDTKEAGSVTNGIREALKSASGNKDCLIYIGGSTFVVSDAVKFFQESNLLQIKR